MEFAEFLTAMHAALDAYRAGVPVVVRDDHARVLHGIGTVNQIAELGLSVRLYEIDGVDRETFERSDWPDRLEQARLAPALRRRRSCNAQRAVGAGGG